MGPPRLQSSVWALAHEQHGVVTRAQLIDLGYGVRPSDTGYAAGASIRWGEASMRLAVRS